jgi:riboflavin kinase/FMN adenylyltransferase
VGTRATTDGERAYENMETHIIGFDGDLYYSFIKVNFYKFLREEKKFADIDELIAQITRDTEQAKDYFLK